MTFSKGNILLTDEIRFGKKMTKFPGGGLEFGEGTIECLKRECREEMGQEIKVTSHFYTTDFYQPSYFIKPPAQLISIYYLFEIVGIQKFKTVETPYGFSEYKEGAQVFRWYPVGKLTESDVSFPIDQKVVRLIKERYASGII